MRVQLTPRFVVLYNPPSPFGGPPHPLNTPTYQIFWVESKGSITRSFVQYIIPDALRSAHVLPPSVLVNTPELAVKAPAAFRRPEYVHTTIPSFSTRMLKGCPSVRGGFVTFVQVEAAPFCTLVETKIPPC